MLPKSLKGEIFLTPFNKSLTFTKKIHHRLNLHGKHLFVAANIEEPFTHPCIFDMVDGKISKSDIVCDLPGISFDIFQFISEFLGFKFTLIQSPDNDFGSLVNNSWSGLVGMLKRREVDVALNPLSYNYLRWIII